MMLNSLASPLLFLYQTVVVLGVVMISAGSGYLYMVMRLADYHLTKVRKHD